MNQTSKIAKVKKDLRSEGTQREKRWAVITQEGHHSWLGRHTDPDEEQLQNVSAQLAKRGLTAWLAVTEGVYYEPKHKMNAVMVRPLAGEGDWEDALSSFLRQRELILVSNPS